MATQHPEKLGKYPITGILGQGAMGVVYRSVDPVIQRPVAIKVIHKQLIGTDPSGTSAAMRFRNEAQAVGRLSHPGIVAIYEYGEDDSSAYIAMELVQGRTLVQVLEATPQLPEADVLHIMGQLLDALDCAHHHGVWHRDIKPANILITPAGQVKITDFGIARIESAALTQVTSTIGTPGYMAPEQYTGVGIDHRVDLFACGVVLYRMLTGEHPFKGSMESVMYQILKQDPTPPSQVVGAKRPAFYDAIVARALAKEKTQRYASAAQFKAELMARASSIPESEAQTTIVINANAGPLLPAPAPTATKPSTTPTGSQRSTTLPTGWDVATLAVVEQALVSFIGPMAKVLVRQAAKTSFDLPSLSHALSQQLSNDQDRSRFLAKLASTGAQLTASTHPHATVGSSGALSPALQAQALGPSSHPGSPLSSAVVAHGLKIMTRQLGPIAAVIVKKAQAKARSREEFFEILSAQIDNASERDQLLQALRGA